MIIWVLLALASWTFSSILNTLKDRIVEKKNLRLKKSLRETHKDLGPFFVPYVSPAEGFVHFRISHVFCRLH